MAISEYNQGVMLILVALFTGHLVKAGPTLLDWARALRWPRPSCLQLAAYVRGLAARCCLVGKAQAELDAFELCVARKVRIQETQHAAKMVWILFAFIMSITPPIFVNICTGRQRWFTPGNDITLLVSLGITVSVVWCPQLTRGAWPVLWQTCLGVLLTTFLLCVQGYETFTFATRMVWPYRICLGLVKPWPRLGATYNFVHLLAMLYRLNQFAASAPAGALVSKVDMVTTMMVEAAIVVALIAFVANTITVRARHEVQEMSLRGEGSAMLNLLNMVCDVVVELDADLCIGEHAPRFAAMLALSPARCTKGAALAGFMPHQSDREKFERHLRVSEDGRPASGALHVRLRDTMMSEIAVEVFFVQFPGLDGQQHHFVGLRESSEPPLCEMRAFPPGAGGAYAMKRCRSSGATSSTSRGSVAESGTFAEWPGTQGDDEGRLACAPDARMGRSSSEGTTPRRTPFLGASDVGNELPIIQAVLAWHVPDHESGCCSFHAAIAHARQAVARLEKHGCQPRRSPLGDVPCGGCAVLRLARSKDCRLCSWRAPRGQPCARVVTLL